jgi:hypothetical protein
MKRKPRFRPVVKKMSVFQNQDSFLRSSARHQSSPLLPASCSASARMTCRSLLAVDVRDVEGRVSACEVDFNLVDVSQEDFAAMINMARATAGTVLRRRNDGRVSI